MPRAVIDAALAHLADEEGITAQERSPIMSSAALGPSLRRYANAAAVVTCALPPPGMLAAAKRTERAFGRTPRGQRWSARVLDLDIILWSGGIWTSPELAIPHPHFRKRTFVLGPAASIAPHWRDPLTGLSLRQLHHRLTRPNRLLR